MAWEQQPWTSGWRALCQTPGRADKWVVLTEDAPTPRHVTDSQLEAVKWEAHHIVEGDSSYLLTDAGGAPSIGK
jgi:hypothetical protein